MGERWLEKRRDDAFYKKAKREGYRARSAYKLLQMDERYGVFRDGDAVVDLGCSPGGWSQVAKERVGKGRVVGIDLAPTEPVEGVEFLRGDMTKPATLEKLRLLIPQADVVLSDMSPNISGQYSLDHARSIHLCEMALSVAEAMLRPGGGIVMKVFEGDMFPDLLAKLRARFRFVKAHHPPASRKESSEVYVIAQGFKGSA